MVIRGNTRGNGRQLAEYLVTMDENEGIHILEANGRENASPEYLRQAILSMDAMADLTKAKKGLYHAQINPAIGEDKNMDWFKAADMLGAELGFEDQRRVIVLHEKKGRIHAHVVWERYDHETGKVKSDSFSRLQQDRARRNMEMEFGHKPTPRRNRHRPELKASLKQLWDQTGTGAQFIAACKNNNYMIAQGVGRSPFIVVDENGHSFDLVRQLSGVRLNDVRQRLRHETLLTEKQAIVYMRNKKAEQERDGTDKQKAKLIPSQKQAAKEFTDAAKEATTKRQTQAERDAAFREFMRNKNPMVQPDNVPEIGKEFTRNAADKTLTEQERIRQALAKERQASRNNGRDRDFGIEPE